MNPQCDGCGQYYTREPHSKDCPSEINELRRALRRRDRVGYVNHWLNLNPHPCSPTGDLPMFCKRTKACELHLSRVEYQWTKRWDIIEDNFAARYAPKTS